MKMRTVIFNLPEHLSGKGTVAKAMILCLLLVVLSHGEEQKAPRIVPQPANPGRILLPGASQNEKLDKPAKLTAGGAITGVTTAQENNDLTITIATNGIAEHKEFTLQDPSRLVVDFVNVDCRVPFLQMPVKSSQVKQVRVRQFQTSNPKIARLVFDLEDGHGPHEIRQDENAVRIVFHPPKQSGSAEGRPAASPRKQKPADESAQGTPKETEGEPRTGGPVIRDLAASEIPRSALKEAKPAPAPKQPVVAPPPPPPPAPVVSRPSPVLSLTALGQESRYSGQPMTLDLVDIPLIDFFRLMAEEGGINVVMDPEIKGTISIKVVKVPWDQIFDAALGNNNLDKKLEGNLVRIATKNTLQNEAKQQESLKKANLLAAELETRIKHLNYSKASTVVSTLTNLITVRGTAVVDERTNSLVLTDIPSSLDKMTQLVDSLDIPQQQVEIEARIVSANRDFARDIGVQFGFVQGNLDRVTIGGPNTFGTIGGTRPSTTPTNTYEAGNPFTGRGASQATATQSGAVSTGSGQASAGNYNVNLPASKAFGGIGLSVGNILDTFLLDAAITAGENKGLAKLISQPKLTTHNNAGTITQGLRFPVQIISNNTVSVQFQNAALTLTVTPQITSEGSIVLDLKVENNTPDFSRQVNGIPSIRTSEAQTRVLVRDGGTTVIGGILIDSETSSEDRVPGLASLPVVGNLFRRSSISHSTQEVLFFITPRILK